jgi:hypothetical protein
MRAQSAPIRQRIDSWRKAVTDCSKASKLLHVGHFAPPRGRRRLTCDLLWGTRGPEFKSRRPDEEKALLEEAAACR